jgi:DNA-binding MarR family transcriptional regulator
MSHADNDPASDRSSPPPRGEDRLEAPRWLSEDEREAWLAVATIMFTLPAALDARLQRDADLTFFDYMVLAVLSEREGRTMQMSEIAAGVSASLSRLSHVAAKLEARGLLVRNRIPGTGRRTSATLTDAGWAVVTAAAPDHVTAVREYIVDALQPSDLVALARIGENVAVRVNPERPFRHGRAS